MMIVDSKNGAAEVLEAVMGARARRAAISAGYVARKSRWRKWSIDNHGGFMIVDSSTNFPVCGFRFDMDAEEVIEWCRAD